MSSFCLRTARCALAGPSNLARITSSMRSARVGVRCGACMLTAGMKKGEKRGLNRSMRKSTGDDGLLQLERRESLNQCIVLSAHMSHIIDEHLIAIGPVQNGRHF